VSLLTIFLPFFSQTAQAASWKTRLTVVLPSPATALCFSPDAKLIAVGHSDGKVTVWETTRGELVKTLAAHAEEIRALRFAPDGAKLITLSRDNQVRLWSVFRLDTDGPD
jgi:WD40 repeat protein